MPSLAGPGRLDGVRGDVGDDDDVVGVNPEELVVRDLIVGRKPERTRKPGAKTCIRCRQNLTEMSEAEWREHVVTHLPYCDGCPFCVAGKKQYPSQDLDPHIRCA